VATAPLGVALGDTVPQLATEQDTFQVTPLLLGSLATVAERCAVAPACTAAVPGETETTIADGGGGGGADEPPPQPLRIGINPTVTRQKIGRLE